MCVKIPGDAQTQTGDYFTGDECSNDDPDNPNDDPEDDTKAGEVRDPVFIFTSTHFIM